LGCEPVRTSHSASSVAPAFLHRASVIPSRVQRGRAPARPHGPAHRRTRSAPGVRLPLTIRGTRRPVHSESADSQSTRSSSTRGNSEGVLRKGGAECSVTGPYLNERVHEVFAAQRSGVDRRPEDTSEQPYQLESHVSLGTNRYYSEILESHTSQCCQPCSEGAGEAHHGLAHPPGTALPSGSY